MRDLSRDISGFEGEVKGEEGKVQLEVQEAEWTNVFLIPMAQYSERLFVTE